MNLLKIPGRGSSKPRVVFIGQSPGREEAEQGRAFCGPAGQLLFQGIREYGLKPAYVTNTVKAYLLGDRDPNASEIEFCLPHLRREVEALNPEIVVTLGNIATKAFLGNSKIKITQVAGHPVKYGKYKVIPVLHPAFVLRYPQNQALFESQLRVVRRELNGELPHRLPKMDKTPNATESLSMLKGVVAFDFETTGITKFDCGKIRIAAFADKNSVFWTDDVKAIANFLHKSDLQKVAHNVGFEMRTCRENFGFWPRNMAYDTVAMHYLLDESSPHRLDILASTFLEAEPWDIEYRMKQHNWTWKTVPTAVLGPYCALDAYYTRRLYDAFNERMSEKLRFVHNKIVFPLAKVCAKMEYSGIKIDLAYASKLSIDYQKSMDETRSKFLCGASVRRAMKKVELDDTLNMNSTHQIRRLFCGGLGLKIEEKTESGLDSIREEAITKYKGMPAIVTYLTWKKAQTIKNNFIDKFPNFADRNGIIRAHMNPCFVTTGRLSVTNPNMQAIPVDPKIRNMFISRFVGGYMLSFDFKQLEMRLVASESGEEKLLEVFKRGGDVHSLTAQLLFGKDFTKDQRSVAKRVNFGIIYGAGAGKLVREFNMTWNTAESLIDKFNRGYPKLYRWMRLQKELIAKHGEITSRFGRVRRLGKVDKLPEWQKAAIERQAGNFPIQSQGADLTNLCLIQANREICKEKLKSKICLQVHDSIIVDTTPKEVDRITKILTRVMTKDVPAGCPWLKVRIEVEVQVEHKWA